MAYNSTVTIHESTGMSPYCLVYGEKMTIPIDIITKPSPEQEVLTAAEYVNQLQSKLRESHRLVRETTKKAAEWQKKQYDFRVQEYSYNRGDWYGEIRRKLSLVSNVRFRDTGLVLGS